MLRTPFDRRDGRALRSQSSTQMYDGAIEEGHVST
jgi:hypothetical protein